MSEVKHYGIPGMRWGKHKIQEQARDQARKTERARFQSDLKTAGKNASIDQVVSIAKKHDKNMAKINADFKKATGREIPSGPVGERFAKSLGMYKDKKGVWQAGPEAYAKATAIGIGLGTAAFFAEMKLKQFVASGAAEKMLQSAEYAKWLKTG